jgi:hypothetical protein
MTCKRTQQRIHNNRLTVCRRTQLDSGKGHELIGEDRFCLDSFYFKFRAIYLGSIKIPGRPVGVLGSAPTIIQGFSIQLCGRPQFDSEMRPAPLTALCGTTGADRFFFLFGHFLIPRTLVAASVPICLPCV